MFSFQGKSNQVRHDQGGAFRLFGKMVGPNPTTWNYLYACKRYQGLVLAEFLVDYLIFTKWELTDKLSNKDVLVIEVLSSWMMYSHNDRYHEKAWARVLFITSENSFSLKNRCLNNIAKYQALILGFRDDYGYELRVFRDFMLVVNQFLDSHIVKKPKVVLYYNYTRHHWFSFLS